MSLIAFPVELFRKGCDRNDRIARKTAQRLPHPAEITVARILETLCRDIADHRKNHLIGIVSTRHETQQIVPRILHQRAFTSQDIVAERRTDEDHILEIVENPVGRRILVRVDFIDDHLLLLLQLALRESRMKNDIGDQLRRLGKIAAQRGSVHHRLLLRRIGVQFAAEILEPTIDMERLAVGRSFEKRMFEQVGEPLFGHFFVPAAGIDRQRTVDDRRTHLFMNAANPVRQGIAGKFHRHFFVFAAPRREFSAKDRNFPV